jgi:hypothetical protein
MSQDRSAFTHSLLDGELYFRNSALREFAGNLYWK